MSFCNQENTKAKPSIFGNSEIGPFEMETNIDEMREMVSVLKNSSYGHEYAMVELQQAEQCQDPVERAAAEHKLEQHKKAYFQARQFLMQNHPKRLQDLEYDLIHQKVRISKVYHA